MPSLPYGPNGPVWANGLVESEQEESVGEQDGAVGTEPMPSSTAGHATAPATMGAGYESHAHPTGLLKQLPGAMFAAPAGQSVENVTTATAGGLEPHPAGFVSAEDVQEAPAATVATATAGTRRRTQLMENPMWASTMPNEDATASTLRTPPPDRLAVHPAQRRCQDLPTGWAHG